MGMVRRIQNDISLLFTVLLFFIFYFLFIFLTSRRLGLLVAFRTCYLNYTSHPNFQSMALFNLVPSTDLCCGTCHLLVFHPLWQHSTCNIELHWLCFQILYLLLRTMDMFMVCRPFSSLSLLVLSLSLSLSLSIYIYIYIYEENIN
jgi:hypothetical protein